MVDSSNSGASLNRHPDEQPAAAQQPVSPKAAATWPPSGEQAGIWTAGPEAPASGGSGSQREPAPGPGGPDQDTRQPRRIRLPKLSGSSADLAGGLLARLTVLPAILIVAWLIPGLPLLLGGVFQPVPMLLIAVPVAAALLVNGLRVVPARWPQPRPPDRPAAAARATWFGLLATIAVVGGLTGWQIAEASAPVIVLRDQGTYLQTGYWIAQHGSLGIPESLKAFGGSHLGLNFTSTGFLQRGTTLYPAALPGLPMLLAGGFWIHGSAAAAAVGPMLGGLATLAFAGLTARLAGPQWAPAGALVLGLCLPQQYVSRTSLSETALQVVLFGGLCLLTDALVVGPGQPTAMAAWSSRLGLTMSPSRLLAGLAGLALGFGLLISAEALIYVLVLIPCCGVLAISHRPQATSFPAGLAIGVCYGVAGGYLLARPFVDQVGFTVAIAGVTAVWLVALSMVAYQLARMPRVRAAVPRLLARAPLRWLPEVAAVVALEALIVFALRPLMQTVRGHPDPAVARFIASLQRAQGLPVDPSRLYSEQTLYWVIWYIGLPTLLLAALGLVLLVRGTVRALVTWRDRTRIWRCWGLPLAVLCAGSVVTLWAPSVIPDQPWASRRLVVLAIPAVVLLAVWASGGLTRWARDHGARPATAAVAGVACAAAMLVPTVTTTFGFGLSHTGKTGGLRPVLQGLALTTTGAGESAAVSQLCAQIPRNASVLILDTATAQRFTQTVRGMCGVPAAWMVGQPASDVDGVIRSVFTAGRRPVLLAGTRAGLVSFGGAPVRALDLATTEDPHDLTELPTTPAPVRYQVWLTIPGSASVGA